MALSLNDVEKSQTLAPHFNDEEKNKRLPS